MLTRRNILIICEGSVTEPQYFHQLRDYIIIQNIQYYITIKPKPPAQLKLEIAAAGANNLRDGAVLRQVSDVLVSGDDYMVEDEYGSQPTRYVREAQQGLLDGTYDEAWAIYDKDGHPNHPEAVALAISDQAHRVHIGFSSIAFEHWLLLHFEYNTTAFIKSECRQQKKVFNCGQHIHPTDCLGANCVSGYMKENGYIAPESNIKEIGFVDLSSMTNTALANAYQLRHNQLVANHGLPHYEINPITTVDRLVLKLLKEPLDLVWEYEQPFDLNAHIAFYFEVNQRLLKITIENTGTSGYIFNEGDFILLDVLGNHQVFFERFTISADTVLEREFDLSTLAKLEPVYIGFKLAENQYSISDLY
jgi:hypothetical protein